MEKALARRMLLERIYDKMTPEEQRLFVLMTMQNRSADDIMRAIQQRSGFARLLPEGRKNQKQLQHIVEHIDRDKWWVAFGSDVAANVLTSSAAWLLGRLLKR